MFKDTGVEMIGIKSLVFIFLFYGWPDKVSPNIGGVALLSMVRGPWRTGMKML